MTLGLLEDGELLMFSAEVDEIWHAHLLFTRDYAEFCQRVFGRFVHHEPIDPTEAVPPSQGRDLRAAFFRSYRQLFGEPSYLWGAAPAAD